MSHLPLPLAFILACGGAPEDTSQTGDTGDTGTEAAPEECADEPEVTWATWGDGFFRTWCQSCHSADTPQRNGAPESVDFDTRADVSRQASAVRRAVLETETMPLGGGLAEDDRLLLDILLRCGL